MEVDCIVDNSREMILKALDHEESDRIPRDLGGTDSSSLSAYACMKVVEHYKLGEIPVIYEPFQYISHTGQTIKKLFSIDTDSLTPGPRQWKIVKDPYGFNVYLPKFGLLKIE